jgi:hypothetical protein
MTSRITALFSEPCAPSVAGCGQAVLDGGGVGAGGGDDDSRPAAARERSAKRE